MRHNLLDRNGYVKLAPKVGDEPYRPSRKSDSKAEIEFCMNCKKRECKHGNCRKFAKMKREMKEDISDVECCSG